MELLYEADKYFIGVVKFFDDNKGFGFIASNNCNMNTSEYYQDFYVNTESFIEDEARNEKKIVVFQIEIQGRNRTRAVNVRLLSTSEEDYNLRLSYYDTHEKIRLKDGVDTNMYSSFRIPRLTEILNICNIICKDPDRSPESTLKHFTRYILHFDVNKISDQQFIFERDYTRSAKSAWSTLVEALNFDEIIEILYNYPCFAIYISDNQIIDRWLDTFKVDNFNISTLKKLKVIFDSFAEETKVKAIAKFEDFLETVIYYKLGISENKSMFDSSKNWLGRNEVPHATIHGIKNGTHISHYLALTSRNYDKEIANRKIAEELKTIKQLIEKLIQEPDNTHRILSLADAYDKLEDKSIITDDIKQGVSQIIDYYIKHNQPIQVIELTTNILVYDEKELCEINERLFPVIKYHLSDLLRQGANETRNLDSFVKSYRELSPTLNSEQKDELKLYLKDVASETSSIEVIAELCTKNLNILSDEDAKAFAEKIVTEWDYDAMNQFLSNCKNYSDGHYPALDVIIEKALRLISDIKLDKSFTPNVEREGKDAIYHNCKYLSHIKKLLSTNRQYELWKKYLETRSLDENIILYNNDIIYELPTDSLELLINSINYKDIQGNVEEWYSTPKIKNSLYQKILESADEELFDFVSNRLTKLELSDSNIPLAVFLLELLRINKPQDADYYEMREWEDQFNSSIDNLLRNNLDNIRLQILFWCIYDTKCKGGKKEFQDIYPSLPPYLQIRVVRKYFNFISQGKISHSAKSLYDFLTNEKNSICLPLEIIFSYLKLKEQDHNATFTNNMMLQILANRDDYYDWSNIIFLMHGCVNRWGIDADSDRWSDRYFNGIIDKLDNGRIKVFIPYKMIDGYRHTKEYNNKHFKTISEVIKLTYDRSEYEVVRETNGSSYIFNSANEIGLYSLSRAFNLKYNNGSEEVSYVTKEEENTTFCECRLSDKLDNYHNQAFHWCSNKPCFRPPIRFMADSEWEYYRLIDFMRILKIPTDYITKSGKVIKHGHYIIFSSYLKSFSTFYEHLFCRDCGNLLKPKNISNYASAAITEFHCTNSECVSNNVDIYINHCFNKNECKAIIDSRDSAQCPNGQYICPNCGGCCSTKNFNLRIEHLTITGGYISPWLRDFVDNERGHWEKNEYYCYICGEQMTILNGTPTCNHCNITYKRK